MPHRPTNYLFPIQAIPPFDQWGIDLLAPFPPASGQRRFVVVAIHYFTKYVEAEALNTISDKQICQSLVEKTSFAAVFWPFFAAILAPSNSDSSKCPTLIAAVKNRNK